MNNSWQRLKISEVCELIVDCVNKTAPTVDYPTPFKMLRTPNIKNGVVDTGNCKYVTSETFDKWTRRAKIQPQDVLLTREAPLGEVGIVKNSSENLFLGQRIMQYRANKNILDPAYLLYSFLSKDLQDQFRSHEGSGSVVSHIRVPDCSKFELFVPPLNEQKKISKILSDLDDKIHLNNQINQTLESIAQAIFKSWFIDFEPVRAKIAAKQAGQNPELTAMCAISGKSEAELQQMAEDDFADLQATAALFPDELVESELGEVPRGWEVQSLYDTAEFVNGAAFKAKDFSSNSEGLPIIKIAELKQGISAQTKYTNSIFDKKYQVSSGDIFYSWSGSPETSLDVFKWFGGEGWLNQHIFKINTKEKGQTYFVYYLLKYLKPTLIRLATNKQTTGLGHITIADMKRLEVIKPAERLFKSYVTRIAPIYEQESLLTQEGINLAVLRDTLLPKLLSGEISLNKNMGSIDD